MKIPDEIYVEWKRLYSHGDAKAIAERTNYHRHTISRALFSGEATKNVIRCINSYYMSKKEERNRELNQFTQELKEQLQIA